MGIIEMGKRLNEVSEERADGVVFNFSTYKDEIDLTIYDNEEFHQICYAKIPKIENELEIIISLINEIYINYINPKNKIVKNWRSFSDQKVKQLEKALLKEDFEKITIIQKDLIERRKLVQNLKFEIQEYKSLIITPMYFIKDELELNKSEVA